MINLDEGVTVAKIAKVREKVSNDDQEFDELEDAMEEIEEDSKEIDSVDEDNFDDDNLEETQEDVSDDGEEV